MPFRVLIVTFGVAHCHVLSAGGGREKKLSWKPPEPNGVSGALHCVTVQRRYYVSGITMIYRPDTGRRGPRCPPTAEQPEMDGWIAICLYFWNVYNPCVFRATLAYEKIIKAYTEL